MGKDKHTGLGKINVSGAAAVVDSLISLTPKTPKLTLNPVARAKKDVTKLELPEFQPPKSEKLQIPMDYELVATLGRIEKWIMSHRKKGQQRITKNSIVRACLKVLLPVLFADPEKLKDISTEQELVEKISDLLKKPHNRA